MAPSYTDALKGEYKVVVPPAAQFEDARAFVLDKLRDDLGAGARVRLSSSPVARDLLLDLAFNPIQPPQDEGFEEAWVAFVDPSPRAKWGHRARYYFIAPDFSRVSEVTAEFPPQPRTESGVPFVFIELN